MRCRDCLLLLLTLSATPVLAGEPAPEAEAVMVYTGWALADRGVSARYLPFERQAKARNHGLWRGRFVAPWDWRRGRRLPEETP